jgi:predicted metalloendopeptidase
MIMSTRRKPTPMRYLGLIAAHLGLLMGANSHAAEGEWRLDRMTMDAKADPCTDFYQYACGGFDVASNIPAGRNSANWQRDAVRLANAESLSQLLLGRIGTEDPEARRLQVFFGSCMNNAAHRTNDAATLQQWLRRIDSEPLPRVLIELQALGVDVLFSYSGEADPVNRARYRGEISWGEFGLRGSTYQASTPDAIEQRQQYRTRIARLLTASGIPEASAATQASAVLELESQLAQSTLPYQDFFNRASREHPTRPAELARAYPVIDWEGYLQRVGHPADAVLNIAAPAHLKLVSELLTQQPDAVWRGYLRWSFLRSLGPTVLPEELSTALGQLNNSGVVGVTRFDACLLETVNALGVELSRQFATRFVPAQSLAAGKQVVRQVQDQLVKSLAAISWMSPQARAEVREKIRLADLKIGYPNTWPATGSFELRADTFLDNVLAARTYETARLWARARSERRRESWEIMVYPNGAAGFAVGRLAIPNGYPDTETNSIILPAASLRPPVLDGAAPLEVLFGGFGTLVAHELIHSADVHQFDALGTPRETWLPQDVAAHERMFACIKGQANQYEVLDGLRLDGERTRYENVADYAGVRHAYEALQSALGARLSRRGPDGLTRAQRFFVAYAQKNCNADTAESLRETVRRDPHAVPRFRVNGPLSNLPAFAKAFTCGKQAPMVRPEAEQCRAW